MKLRLEVDGKTFKFERHPMPLEGWLLFRC